VIPENRNPRFTALSCPSLFAMLAEAMGQFICQQREVFFECQQIIASTRILRIVYFPLTLCRATMWYINQSRSGSHRAHSPRHPMQHC
jgi:hypothetical protein